VNFSFAKKAALFSLLGLMLTGAPAHGLSATFASPIRRDLINGHAQQALNLISSALAENPRDAEALELRCRVLLQERHWNQAAESCQAAATQAPDSSSVHYWLGRAYGEQARRAPRLTAFMLARKLHAQFEKAIALDPSNVAAYDALGEFYVEAPAIAGGGIAKALALKGRLQALSPARAHALAAEIAESEKNYPLAEQECKAQIASSHHPPEAWMDLAGFYRRRGEMDAMVSAIQKGIALDKDHDLAMVDGARLLIQTGRNLPEAARWLQEYLASSHQSEDAPAFAVHAELARLLEQMGETPAAQQQMAQVEMLAPGYKPRS